MVRNVRWLPATQPQLHTPLDRRLNFELIQARQQAQERTHRMNVQRHSFSTPGRPLFAFWLLIATAAALACTDSDAFSHNLGGGEGSVRVRTEIDGVDFGASGPELRITGSATNLDSIPMELALWYSVSAGNQSLDRVESMPRTPLAADTSISIGPIRLSPADLLRPQATPEASASTIALHVEYWSAERQDAPTFEELLVLDFKVQDGIVYRISSSEASELRAGLTSTLGDGTK